MKCISTSLCGMNGNILLLFIIYLIIPSSYYEKLLEILDPKKLQKTVNEDALGIEKISKKIGIDNIENKIVGIFGDGDEMTDSKKDNIEPKSN